MTCQEGSVESGENKCKVSEHSCSEFWQVDLAILVAIRDRCRKARRIFVNRLYMHAALPSVDRICLNEQSRVRMPTALAKQLA